RALGVETLAPAVVEHVSDGLVGLRIGHASLVAVADVAVVPGAEVYACVRASDVIVEAAVGTRDSARNHLNAQIVNIEREGAVDRLTLDCGFELIAAVTSRSLDDLGLAVGSPVVAAIKATAIQIVPKA